MPPVTKALLLICTALFCVDQFVNLRQLFALWPLGSGAFWPWQLVTYAFLHGDTLYLFFTMLGLWMFGGELERLWGQPRFLHFLLASVLAAAFTQLAVSALTGSNLPAAGASGALFGVLLATSMLFPNRTIMPFFPPIPMKTRTYVILFGAIELGMGVLSSTGGGGHFAHLGGMLGAFLMIRYWRGQSPFKSNRRR